VNLAVHPMIRLIGWHSAWVSAEIVQTAWNASVHYECPEFRK
jgi:hypothetical protein